MAEFGSTYTSISFDNAESSSSFAFLNSVVKIKKRTVLAASLAAKSKKQKCFS